MTVWSYILISIAIPVGAFTLFLAGRLMGWGWAKSWFQAKKQHELENHKENKT